MSAPRLYTKPAGRAGFTLVELLVAITIMAVVAVLGWRGLDSIVRARVSLNRDLEQSRGLQLAFSQMQSDCAHIATSANIGGHTPILAIGERLLLVRTVTLENQPSQIQVIAYQIRDGVLQRIASPVTRDLVALDAYWNKFAQEGLQEQAVALQSEVASMRLRIWLVGAANWIGTAPGEASGMLQGGAPVTVKGLEVALQLRGSERFLTKVLLLGPV